MKEVELKRQEARRTFEEARIAREKATQEQIEKQGINPDDKELSPGPDQDSAPKRLRIDKRNISKVYNNRGSGKAPIRKRAVDRRLQSTNSRPKSFSLFAGGKLRARLAPGLQEIHVNYVHRKRELSSELRASYIPFFTTEVTSSTFDMIGSICTSADLAVDVCKHLRPKEIVMLYSISKDFHDVINTFMRSCILRIAGYKAPLASRIFHYWLYRQLCIPDPEGRPQDPAYHDFAHLSIGTQQAQITEMSTRTVPSLRWLRRWCIIEAREFAISSPAWPEGAIGLPEARKQLYASYGC